VAAYEGKRKKKKKEIKREKERKNHGAAKNVTWFASKYRNSARDTDFFIFDDTKADPLIRSLYIADHYYP